MNKLKTIYIVNIDVTDLMVIADYISMACYIDINLPPKQLYDTLQEIRTGIATGTFYNNNKVIYKTKGKTQLDDVNAEEILENFTQGLILLERSIKQNKIIDIKPVYSILIPLLQKYGIRIKTKYSELNLLLNV